MIASPFLLCRPPFQSEAENFGPARTLAADRRCLTFPFFFSSAVELPAFLVFLLLNLFLFTSVLSSLFSTEFRSRSFFATSLGIDSSSSTYQLFLLFLMMALYGHPHGPVIRAEPVFPFPLSAVFSLRVSWSLLSFHLYGDGVPMF